MKICHRWSFLWMKELHPQCYWNKAFHHLKATLSRSIKLYDGFTYSFSHKHVYDVFLFIYLCKSISMCIKSVPSMTLPKKSMPSMTLPKKVCLVCLSFNITLLLLRYPKLQMRSLKLHKISHVKQKWERNHLLLVCLTELKSF